MQALTEVTWVLAEADQHEQAAAMASQAETMARSITDLYERAQALTAVAAALTQACQHEQAETVARSITDPGLAGGRTGRSGQGAGGEGRYETGAPRGLSGVCRRPLDQGPGAGVVDRVVSGQSAHEVQ